LHGSLTVEDMTLVCLQAEQLLLQGTDEYSVVCNFDGLVATSARAFPSALSPCLHQNYDDSRTALGIQVLQLAEVLVSESFLATVGIGCIHELDVHSTAFASSLSYAFIHVRLCYPALTVQSRLLVQACLTINHNQLDGAIQTVVEGIDAQSKVKFVLTATGLAEFPASVLSINLSGELASVSTLGDLLVAINANVSALFLSEVSGVDQATIEATVNSTVTLVSLCFRNETGTRICASQNETTALSRLSNGVCRLSAKSFRYQLESMQVDVPAVQKVVNSTLGLDAALIRLESTLLAKNPALHTALRYVNGPTIYAAEVDLAGKLTRYCAQFQGGLVLLTPISNAGQEQPGSGLVVDNVTYSMDSATLGVNGSFEGGRVQVRMTWCAASARITFQVHALAPQLLHVNLTAGYSAPHFAQGVRSILAMGSSSLASGFRESIQHLFFNLGEPTLIVTNATTTYPATMTTETSLAFGARLPHRRLKLGANSLSLQDIRLSVTTAVPSMPLDVMNSSVAFGPGGRAPALGSNSSIPPVLTSLSAAGICTLRGSKFHVRLEHQTNSNATLHFKRIGTVGSSTLHAFLEDTVAGTARLGIAQLFASHDWLLAAQIFEFTLHCGIQQTFEHCNATGLSINAASVAPLDRYGLKLSPWNIRIDMPVVALAPPYSIRLEAAVGQHQLVALETEEGVQFLELTPKVRFVLAESGLCTWEF
jgi:hypothetical protein